MKKVIVAAAIVLGSFVSFANATQPVMEPTGINANEGTFKEIPVEKLPQAVKDAFKADFKTATLNKA